MRIQILSDLHREFGPGPELLRSDADLIVLAGDISTKQNALPWIREYSAGIPVVYICGNHEFYGDKHPKVADRLLEYTKDSNIHFLENSAVGLHGWQIFGCTLWTDMALNGDWREGSQLAADRMNDYKRIRNSERGYKRLAPADTRNLHRQSLRLMEEFLSRNHPDRAIIVTHHAPSALSLPETRRNDPLSCAYASHLDDFILRHQPRLWIHGHTHFPCSYSIGKTRIIANPQGYPDSVDLNFDPHLIFEV